MPKIAKGKRSPIQERLLTSLAMLACTVGKGDYFRATAINRIMGGRWTDHRKKALQGLIESKWVEEKRVRLAFGIDEYFYRLTETAFVSLSDSYDIKKWEVVKASCEQQSPLM